jgi:hypothetical protein
MEKAIEILRTQLRFFENEYEKANQEYFLALKFARGKGKIGEIKETKNRREVAWVRYVTVGNAIEEIVKESERVDA